MTGAGGGGAAGSAAGDDAASTVVLRSVYAESESDYLEFKLDGPGGQLELLETPWSQRLDPKVSSLETPF